MELLQKDIFGANHKTQIENEKKKTLSTYKTFREVSLADGANPKSISEETMLILRILQRKILYSGLTSDKARDLFLRVFFNELNIKSGKIDSATSVRDSLIAFFGR
ncbi:MAG: hypothetical protein LBE97_01295 [Holosporales bacterium]|jgi:hypothetical protein|nr:hypothetical protein [Holosporales bacterium]